MIGRLTRLLAPAPPAPPIADPAQIASQSRYWRLRILYSTMIGYSIFYFVRKNLSVAMPVMERDLGITKADLGLFLTLHGLFYGLSKFANGVLGDRANPRFFMPLGLVCAAAMNIAFGLSSGVATLGIFWLLNGWFQGMGFPPCAKSLSHWFGPKERGTKFAIWNTSHPVGSATVLVLCGWLVANHWRAWMPEAWAPYVPASWRLCFFLPAAIALVGAVFLVNRLRDRPESLGLPSIVEQPSGQAQPERPEEEVPFGRFLLENVFLNPMVWVVSLANFFVYTVRYTFLDWGPTLLHEMKGLEIQHTSWIVAAYELTGVVGILFTGWLTDRVKGKGSRVCCVSMILCGLCIFLFWKLPTSSMAVYTLLLCGTGFCIYGPQCLVGVIAANLASRRAAATAIGLTGLFGYLSTVLSGWGLGKLVKETGSWNPAFAVLLTAAGAAAVLFAIAHNAAYHPDEARNE